MKVVGTATMDAPIGEAWDAFLTPEVLISTIPGCERLEETGENEYLATVSIGVGSIKGSYQGTVKLSDLKKHESLTLNASAAAATGTIEVEVAVTFTDLGENGTQIDYDADAIVGGMIGGVGQRMLTSVSKRMANQFFSNVNDVITGQQDSPEPVHAVEAPGAAPQGRIVSASGTVSPATPDGFFKGFIVGALTALLGALVGALAARRR